jgi:hypothetical protein
VVGIYDPPRGLARDDAGRFREGPTFGGLSEMGKKRQRATSEGGYADARGRWQDAHHTISTVEIPGPLADAIVNLISLLDTHMKGQYIFSILKIKEDENYSGDIIAAVSPFVGRVALNREKGTK